MKYRIHLVLVNYLTACPLKCVPVDLNWLTGHDPEDYKTTTPPQPNPYNIYDILIKKKQQKTIYLYNVI
jgi:hypothetical protein